MVERPKDELLDHEYDGIREFDNPCPAWWHLIFIGSVVFSVFYWAFFHLGPALGTNGWTPTEAYEQAYAGNLQLQFSEIGELTVNEATILKYMKKPDATSSDAKDWLAIGATVFKTNCKSCHADDGRGLVGPNLTDDNYKNVKELIDIASVIENGAAAGSMPAWQNRLIPNEIVLVSAYVANLRGKNVPNGKKPEGNVIPPWPKESAETPATDKSAEAEEPAVSEEKSAAEAPPAEENPTAVEATSADETPTPRAAEEESSAEETPSDE